MVEDGPLSDIGRLLEKYPLGFDLAVRVTPVIPPQLIVLHVSVVSVSNRLTGEPVESCKISGRDLRMNIHDDEKVTLQATGKDVAGNVVPLATVAFASSDESVISVTDNGDGTAVATTTGVLTVVGAPVTVTVTDTETSGATFLGSISFDVTTDVVAAIDVAAGVPESRL